MAVRATVKAGVSMIVETGYADDEFVKCGLEEALYYAG